MPSSIPGGVKIVREWLSNQASIPEGTMVFPEEYDAELRVREFRVMLPIRFKSTGERKTFRLFTLEIADKGSLRVIEDRASYVLSELLGGTDCEVVGRRPGTVTDFETAKPYGRANPPLSVQAAMERLEEHLLPKEERILIQLETANQSTFASLEIFQAWKNGATKALGYARTEIAYVNDWIRANHGNDGMRQKPNPLTPYSPEMAKQLTAEVAQKVAEIGARFVPVYSAEHLPPDVEAALQRKVVLEGLGATIAAFDSQLIPRMYPAGISKKGRTKMRRPLISIDEQVRTELAAVTTYLQQSGSSPVPILLAIVDRVVAEGFVLTDQEYADLNSIAALYQRG